MGEACTPPEQSLGRVPNILMFGKAESGEAIPGGKTQVKRSNRMECPGARTQHPARWWGALRLPHPSEPPAGTMGLRHPGAAPMLSDTAPGNSP